MNKTLVALFMLVPLFLGCQHSIERPLPKEGKPETHAKVLIVTENLHTFSAHPVYLDGFISATMHAGKYLEFYLPPGTHSVGAISQTVTLDFSAGETYAFEIRELGWFRRLEVPKALEWKALCTPNHIK